MSHAPIRVLIIEDNAADAVHIRRLLRETLTTSGVEVKHLEDGHHALAAAREFQPDAIFIDYEMPGRNGLDVLAEIHEELPLIPTIMITGVGDEGVAVNVWHAGAKDYLAKDDITGPSITRALFRAIALARYDASLRTAMHEASDLRVERSAALEASTDPALLLDRSGGIVEANRAACETLGWSHTEIIGRDFHDLAHRLRPPEVNHDPAGCDLEKALRENAEVDLGPDSLCTATGSFVPLNLTVRPVAPGGVSRGSIVMARPRRQTGTPTQLANEQAATLQRLRREEQERTDMLNVIGHLIQTPLTPIMLHLGVLQRRGWDELDAKQQGSVQAIERNVQRIKTVFETVSTVTRLKRGERPMKPAPTDIMTACKEVIGSAKERAAERFVKVHTIGESGEGLVDPDAWQTAFDHVLAMSIERTPPDGTILLQIETGERFIDVVLTDTGPQLSGSELRGLIDPFGFLMGDTSTGQAAERALKFYVARVLLEAQNGQLEVLSQGPMTMFICRLPRAPKEATETDRDRLQQSLASAAQSMEAVGTGPLSSPAPGPAHDR